MLNSFVNMVVMVMVVTVAMVVIVMVVLVCAYEGFHHARCACQCLLGIP